LWVIERISGRLRCSGILGRDEGLLRPFPAEKMTCWQVDKDVGNVRNDRPDLIDPVPVAQGLFAL